jgi:hypothetical protein
MAVLYGRVLWGSHSELASARAAEQARELDGAVTHYRRAIGWYAPLSPHGAHAIAALERIAADSAAQGKRELALSAARAIHAGIQSARSAFTPYGQELARADALMRQLAAEPSQPPSTPVLAPPDPSAFFSALAFLSWLGFVGSALALVTLGSEASGQLNARARVFALWLLASGCVFAGSLALA